MWTFLQFVFVSVGGITVALLTAWLFIRRDRAVMGILCGFIPIIALWIIAEWWVISGCMACGGRGLCCEWTGVGVLIYTLVAFIAGTAYLAAAIGVAILHKNLFSVSEAASAQAKHLPGRHLRALYVWLVIAATTSLGGFLTYQGVGATNSDFFSSIVLTTVGLLVGYYGGIFLCNYIWGKPRSAP